MHAEDGEEAMQLVEEGEVDLALLDVMMPRRSIAEAVDLVSQKTVVELTRDLSSCGCFVKTKTFVPRARGASRRDSGSLCKSIRLAAGMR